MKEVRTLDLIRITDDPVRHGRFNTIERWAIHTAIYTMKTTHCISCIQIALYPHMDAWILHKSKLINMRLVS